MLSVSAPDVFLKYWFLHSVAKIDLNEKIFSQQYFSYEQSKPAHTIPYNVYYLQLPGFIFRDLLLTLSAWTSGAYDVISNIAVIT